MGKNAGIFAVQQEKSTYIERVKNRTQSTAFQGALMYIQDQVGYAQLGDDILSFFRAISVDSIHLELRTGVSQTNLSLVDDLKTGKDCTDIFAQAREKVEAHGMKLNNIFMSAWPEITLAKEDRDEKIGAWCNMLDSVGKAGIPCLGWNFKPMGNFRTPSDVGRGGVKYSTFDYDDYMKNRKKMHEPPVSENEMWANMEKFLKAAIPAAEKAGVKMALHPDDPPIPEPLGGVAQICSTLEQFRKIFFELAPSDHNAMLFCQGCMTELLGPEKVYDAIAEMASKKKIAWVHFRNVKGQIPRFVEVFMDEGEVNMKRAMEVYRDNGFNGPFMMDHTPHFAHGYSDLHGKAFAIGYIRALIQEVYG
jgi:mannonate dehydratase